MVIVYAVTQPLIADSEKEPDEAPEPHAQPATPNAANELVETEAPPGDQSADASPEDADRLAALDQIRAAVLGACDGIVTTGALVTGIAAANASQHQLLLSAIASMASGVHTCFQMIGLK
jgi:vacuolar iron transporter family protein